MAAVYAAAVALVLALSQAVDVADQVALTVSVVAPAASSVVAVVLRPQWQGKYPCQPL